MATGGNNANELEVTVMSGSEDVFDYICQPCSEERVKEAVGFCVDCGEYLCEECFKYHTLPRPMKHHVLLTMEQMKENKQGVKEKDRCTEKCDQHKGKRIKYFCRTHDTVGCSMCIFQQHRSCDVSHLQDVAKDISSNTEYKDFNNRLETVTKDSNHVMTEVKENIVEIENSHTETIDTIRNFRVDLNDALDKIENILTEKAAIRKEEQIGKMNDVFKKCQGVVAESAAIQHQLEILEKRGQHYNAYVSMKRSEHKLNPMEADIKKAQESTGITKYLFDKNDGTLETLKLTEGFGKLREETISKSQANYAEMSIKHLTDIPVKSENESTCRISGSALLPNCKLVLADLTNEKVKLIDTEKSKMISELKLNGKPWAIAKVNDDTVAVSVYDKRKIMFIKVENCDLVTEKEVKVNGKCFGVAVADDTLIITCKEPDKLEILCMNEYVLKSFNNDTQIFATPQYVALSPDNQTMYISNLTNNTLICMKRDGTVLATYRDNELKGPEQVAVDSNGMMFVCGFHSNNVILFTPECVKVKVLLTEADGVKNAYSISYCEKEGILYVGMHNSDYIKVFKVYRCKHVI